MRIVINGICGRMGREIRRLTEEGYEGAVLAGGADPAADGSDARVKPRLDEVTADADCLVDFSHHSCTAELVSCAMKHRLPAVIATTGQTEEEMAKIREAAKIVPVFMSANMSFGVALLIELARLTARAMPDADIEIVEKHHNRKLDAPSGTALMLARAIGEVRENATLNLGRSGHGKRQPGEIGIHALRMGSVIGEHEVIVSTDSQTITLKHEAHSRALFAEGALKAARFLLSQEPGIYGMKDMIDRAD